VERKMTITIVGLGPGDPAQLTREAWDVLSTPARSMRATARHPTLAGLPAGLVVHSFDDIYDSVPEFDRCMPRLRERVVGWANGRRASCMRCRDTRPWARRPWAHPGPGGRGRMPVRVVAGLSFVEAVLTALQVDALPNLQIADALDLAARHHPSFHPDAPALVAQLYSAAIAADVKLTLMNQYPDDHGVALVHAVGLPSSQLNICRCLKSTAVRRIAHLDRAVRSAAARGFGV
jgi:tetrapyrrole methylase family protein/MazG family protein